MNDGRDPSALGKAMLQARRENPSMPMTQATDMFDFRGIELYDPSETMVQSTVATRQKELRDRAARGDKYAISMLETGLPGDSDE